MSDSIVNHALKNYAMALEAALALGDEHAARRCAVHIVQTAHKRERLSAIVHGTDVPRVGAHDLRRFLADIAAPFGARPLLQRGFDAHHDGTYGGEEEADRGERRQRRRRSGGGAAEAARRDASSSGGAPEMVSFDADAASIVLTDALGNALRHGDHSAPAGGALEQAPRHRAIELSVDWRDAPPAPSAAGGGGGGRSRGACEEGNAVTVRGEITFTVRNPVNAAALAKAAAAPAFHADHLGLSHAQIVAKGVDGRASLQAWRRHHPSHRARRSFFFSSCYARPARGGGSRPRWLCHTPDRWTRSPIVHRGGRCDETTV